MFWIIYEKLCKEKGLSPNAVAKTLSIASGTVTEWKKGKRTPQNATLFKIANFFGVSPDYLLTGKEKKSSLQENFTFEELEIIYAYRSQPEAARKVVRRALGLEGISPDAATAAYGGKDTQVGKHKEN